MRTIKRITTILLLGLITMSTIGCSNGGEKTSANTTTTPSTYYKEEKRVSSIESIISSILFNL